MDAKIKKFLEMFEMMRKYQKAYFKNRTIPDLQKEKQYESICDKLFVELTTEGYPAEAIQDVLL